MYRVLPAINEPLTYAIHNKFALHHLYNVSGYEAVGVEIDEALVRESRELAARYDTHARFERGSYDKATPGLEIYTAQKRAVVYVYPWPGEEPFFLRLFAETADPGAFLLMCLGPEDIRTYRKKGG